MSLFGIGVLALAFRNCVRLWRAEAGEAFWALVVAVVLVTLFGALWATGPLAIGVWRWSSLVPGTFAAYLMVVLWREVRRRLSWGKATGQRLPASQ